MTSPSPPALARLEASAARHDVRIGDTAVTWRRFGAGRPLVLLHGGHGSWQHWARNIERLSSAFTLWLPDLPGYGDSSAPRAPTLDALLEATHASLDALVGADTPVALAGFSFGGLVAAHLAARRPGVRRLALLGPAGHGGTRRPRGALQSWRDARERQDDAALREVMRHNLRMHMLAGDEVGDEALDIHLRACLATRFHSKPISRAGGLDDCLQRYAGPVLLLWGEHDVTATPHELVPRLQAQRDGTQAEVVAGAGHWVQYDAADTVDQRLLDWFAPA